MTKSYDYLLGHPTLSVDPIFGYVMSKKENCLKLLQAALPKLNLTAIIRIAPQKHLSLKMFEQDSRYDIWSVDKQGRKYDIEIQTSSDPEILERAWRYLLRLQTSVEPVLKPGEKRGPTHSSYVLFFCTFPPGKETRAKYSYSMHDDEFVDRRLDQLGHIVMFNALAPDRSMISAEMAEILDFLVGKMRQQPGKFIIGLNELMTEYLNTQEWRDYMNDFQRYKEELSREKFNEGQAQGEAIGKAQERTIAVRKMAARLRKLHLSDTEIMQSLQEDYGSSFSEDQLLKFINNAK